MLTLPVIQFYNSLFGSDRWIHDNNNNILQIDACDKKIDLGKGYTFKKDKIYLVKVNEKLNLRN